MPLMKNILFIIGFLICNNLWAQDGSELQAEAKLKIKEKKNKEALVLYNKTIDLNPSNPEYYLERSDVHFNLEKYEEGFSDINKAISINPAYFTAYLKRGHFFYLIREYDKAILDYSTALELADSDSLKNLTLIERSGAKAAKRDHAGAIKDCRMALEIDSLSIGALNNLAISLDEAGDKEEVLGILKKIIEIDPASFYPYMNIGYKLSLMGQYKESLQYFDKAIEIDPEQPYTYSNRGYSKLMLSDVNGALKDINKSIKLDPSNSYAYRNRGLVYQAQGKNKKACEEWETALKWGFATSYGNEVHELIKSNCIQ